METMQLKKSEIVSASLKKMESDLRTEKMPLREAVAETCRILFAFGHDSGLSGQITARTETPGTYWTQRLGLGFDEITSDNLLLVDEDLNVLKGEGMPNPANRFHSWLYRARPDINCIVHSHAPHASALAMLEVPLNISHMDTCVLYDQVAFLGKWPGIPVGNEEGEIISGALGNKKAILLSHHGLLVCGASVEEACVLGVMFERAARLQLLAMAAGEIQPIPHDLGAEAQKWVSTPRRFEATFAYYSRRARRELPPL
ncbi:MULTISPECIES: aldolase [unclassified Achromobacter]|uniref:aldolase n=1 Tax=unclassified Achromobacter TaxID=2626865 RepID=UPI000B519F02|nr:MULTISPECIES: aldolase [unclassified Achromobacter]OWT72753.1 aldolase [Achromobacter sp. HZ34]OWT73972.1 aldolase [Achromobacter sp. HZ28]